jgi:hypothetical protein
MGMSTPIRAAGNARASSANVSCALQCSPRPVTPAATHPPRQPSTPTTSTAFGLSEPADSVTIGFTSPFGRCIERTSGSERDRDVTQIVFAVGGPTCGMVGHARTLGSMMAVARSRYSSQVMSTYERGLESDSDPSSPWGVGDRTYITMCGGPKRPRES